MTLRDSSIQNNIETTALKFLYYSNNLHLVQIEIFQFHKIRDPFLNPLLVIRKKSRWPFIGKIIFGKAGRCSKAVTKDPFPKEGSLATKYLICMRR